MVYLWIERHSLIEEQQLNNRVHRALDRNLSVHYLTYTHRILYRWKQNRYKLWYISSGMKHSLGSVMKRKVSYLKSHGAWLKQRLFYAQYPYLLCIADNAKLLADVSMYIPTFACLMKKMLSINRTGGMFQ